MTDKDKEALDEWRNKEVESGKKMKNEKENNWWRGHNCILNIKQIVGCVYAGYSGSYEVYKVAFKNGCCLDIKGNGLIDAIVNSDEGENGR